MLLVGFGQKRLFQTSVTLVASVHHLVCCEGDVTSGRRFLHWVSRIAGWVDMRPVKGLNQLECQKVGGGDIIYILAFIPYYCAPQVY